MKLILHPTRNGNFFGRLYYGNSESKEIFCRKQKEKAKTGAEKFVIIEVKRNNNENKENKIKIEGKKKIGVLVIGNTSGEIRIENSVGKLIGKAYFKETKMSVAEFKSKKNGKKYLLGFVI